MIRWRLELACDRCGERLADARLEPGEVVNRSHDPRLDDLERAAKANGGTRSEGDLLCRRCSTAPAPVTADLFGGAAVGATFDAHLDDVPYCPVCGRQFTNDEWEARHTLPDGEDAHARCCETEGPCARGGA